MNGPQLTFDDVYRQYRRQVRNRVLQVAGTEFAEDALQDAWLNVWRKLHTYNGRAAISSWLYRVATNAAIDHLRRRRRQFQPADDIQEYEDALMHPAPLPDASYCAAVTHAELLRALATLPPTHSAIVLSVYFDGLTLQEAAVRHQLPLGTVKSRLYRARRTVANKVRHPIGGVRC